MIPALYIDVGRDDPYVDENRAFAGALTSMHVGHVYAEYPGAHSWAYWSAHVGQSLAWIEEHIGR
jgi:S-formylglutathione hydrolase FrmB